MTSYEPAPSDRSKMEATPARTFASAIATSDKLSLLTCPRCGSGFSCQNELLSCSNCRYEVPVEDDIFCFSSREPYWNLLPRPLMRQLIASAPRVGWREAMVSHVLNNPNHELAAVYDYATSENRADGLYLLSLSRDKVALDCGCGFGNLSLVLAQRCASVTALDSTSENLQWVAERARQEGIGNLQFVLANLVDPPLQEETFDLAVMNGVLEWVGTARTDLSPKRVQELVLRKVFNLLRPGGEFYLAIENRISYRYFLGRIDEHSDLPFTTVLPRAVADLYSKAVKGRPYRTYTHSLGTYEQMLRGAGFGAVDSYIALPDYRFPRWIVPAHDAAPFRYVLSSYLRGHHKTNQNVYLASVVALKLGIYKYFAPAFVFVGRK